jgi:hypothetical protein
LLPYPSLMCSTALNRRVPLYPTTVNLPQGKPFAQSPSLYHHPSIAGVPSPSRGIPLPWLDPSDSLGSPSDVSWVSTRPYRRFAPLVLLSTRRIPPAEETIRPHTAGPSLRHIRRALLSYNTLYYPLNSSTNISSDLAIMQLFFRDVY